MIPGTNIWTPERGGLASDRVRYPGFPERHGNTWRLIDGDCTVHHVPAGATLRLATATAEAADSVTAQLVGVNSDNQFSLAALGLDDSLAAALPLAGYRHAPLEECLRARSLSVHDARAIRVDIDGAGLVLSANRALTLFVVLPGDSQRMVDGSGTAALDVQLVSDVSVEDLLPEPLGPLRDEFRIDRATACAYELREGEMVQVIDVQGRQCSDFMAMNSAALEAGDERYIDTAVTRSMARGAYPLPGLFDKFFDQDIRPLLAVVQDTVGRHDTFALACTARGYEERGFPGHVNCSDNISDAYDAYSIQRRDAWPAINFFFNSWIHPTDNQIRVDEAWSRPGDYVLMRALRDLVCVSTACPDDIDPINGWNPTDIHVRIYHANDHVRRAVAYRPTQDADPVMTQESPFHPRTSALTQQFGVARDVWAPMQFDATSAIEEYWASRDAVTIQDMCSLRKLDIAGPDAERLLQQAMTRDVRKLAVNRGFYALICDERAAVIDDGTLFRLAPDLFRWCCGSDDSALHLRGLAESMGLRVWVRDMSSQLANLAVQGPRSRDVLGPLLFTQPSQPRFDAIKWFGFCIARLNDREGVPMMVTRSGFTGELGYEIFCDVNDALGVWDAVLEAGAAHGMVPMGGHALNLLRVEAGLMIAGAEFGGESDPDESGLSFAVDMKKDAFVGREAIERNRSAPRRKLVGLVFDGEEIPVHGDGVFAGRRQVGVVTSAVRSPALSKVIAMARLAVEIAETGSALEVGKLDQHSKRLPCEVVDIPFIDPARTKARA